MHKLTFSLTLFIKIFSYKEKRTHISLNKKSNTESYTDYEQFKLHCSDIHNRKIEVLRSKIIIIKGHKILSY